MSFDKQNFARTIQEQHAGISPQMWPIMCPDNGHLVLQHPYEININPCDCLWIPATYDASYGPNPAQYDTYMGTFFPSPQTIGQNVVDIFGPTPQVGVMVGAPNFSLRFNTPNNPWILFGLSTGSTFARWGSGGVGISPVGASTFMRSITGPISRLWIKYNAFAYVPNPNVLPLGANQILLMSMLGYSQSSFNRLYPYADPGGANSSAPPSYFYETSCGGYRTSDLNSSDLRVLGQSPYPVAPTPAGAGSTKG